MPGGIPFQAGETVTLATVLNTSASVALPNPLANRTVHVANLDNTNPVFVKFGSSSVVAVAATSIAVLPFESMIFSVPDGLTHIAAIRGTGVAAADVNITSGWSGYST